MNRTRRLRVIIKYSDMEVSEKDFTLSKVKLLPKGGIQAEYQVMQVVGEEATVIDRSETSSRDVHPDLLGLFESLRAIVARVLNITAFLSLTDGIGLNESQVQSLRDYAELLTKNIDVRGVSWSGTDENEGVVITAVLETPNGLKTCVNTPRIKLGQVSFGFEEELSKIVSEIDSEVYAYLFQGKQAQLSLFGENNDLPEA